MKLSSAREARDNSVEASTLAERWLPALDIGLTVLAAAIWYVKPQEGMWPLGLIALAWLLRRAVYGYFTRTTPLDAPLLLFLLSALAGAMIGYNRDVRWLQGPAPLMWAWAKFWYIVAAIALFYAVANLRNVRQVWGLVRLYALIGALMVIFFVYTNDWNEGQAKFSLLTQLGMWLTVALPRVPGFSLQPNVAGGMMAMIAPFFVPLLRRAHLQGHRRAMVFWALTSSVAMVGLLLSASRGAWIALGAACVIWFLAHLAGSILARNAGLRERVVAQRRLAVVVPLIAIAVSLIWLGARGFDLGGLIYAFGTLVNSDLPGGISGISRLALLKGSWPLAQDYFLTGGGLGAFAMLYSTYSLLIPVFFLPNGHNLLLDILIEQGLFGLLAYLVLLAAFSLYAVRALLYDAERLDTKGQGGPSRWIIEAAVLSAAVAFAHSMVEDVSYGSIALLLLFVPAAMAIALREYAPRSALGLSWRWAAVGAGATVLLLLWQRNLFMSTLYANLGALGQAQVELGTYHWPERLPEQARRGSNLSQAVADFGLALQYDPRNRTANQRLGAIELARGQFDSARGHLEAAYPADPSNEVTWQLLGDSYLALGRLDDAYTLWSRVGDASNKLEVEAWARYEQYGDQERAGWARLVAQKIRTGRVTSK